MTINRICCKSPVLAGLFCCLLLFTACRDQAQPDAVTRLFWLAMSANNLSEARQLATAASRDAIGTEPLPAWKIATLKTGQIRIDGDRAEVETQVDYDRPGPAETLHFDTFLLREDNAWKVDYLKTRDFMPLHPFNELLKSLQNLGDTFGRQLQRQLPQIEEGVRSFGEQLNEQLKQLQRDLEKAFPPPPPGRNPEQGKTI